MAQSQPQHKEKGIKKMKQGMSYTCKEKTIILNVFKYFKQEYPEICVTEVVRRTAKATGCSEKSVFQFRKEEASAEGFKEPSKTKIRKNININSRDIKYDNSVRQAIREIIYDLKYHSILPSLNTIRKRINDTDCLPNFSLMTLRRLLFDMGFSYEKNGNKSILVEKQCINGQKSDLKKTNCDQQNSNTSFNNPNKNHNENKNNLVNIHNSSQTSANKNGKPQIVQMKVIQNSVNNIMNHTPNNCLSQDNSDNRYSTYFRHTEGNINNIVPVHSTSHNFSLMFNHRDDIISQSSIVHTRNNLNEPAKCDVVPWMNPPPPHNK